MRSNASPGPDGFNAAFYKAAWPWIRQDVLQLVTDFYSSAILHSDINRTFIALIPKKTQAMTPQDFRPISLCNVSYKIIAKSLAERLKPHLPGSIHAGQTAFVHNRHITTNIIASQEIIHSFNLNNWNHMVFILKIDLAKAFDRINWNFIATALKRLGLSDHFISLIYSCISTNTFSVLVNGQPTDFLKPAHQTGMSSLTLFVCYSHQ